MGIKGSLLPVRLSLVSVTFYLFCKGSKILVIGQKISFPALPLWLQKRTFAFHWRHLQAAHSLRQSPMIELTNALRRQIAALDKAKERRLTRWFRAEGAKCVLDTLDAFPVIHLLATHQWIEDHPKVAEEYAGVLTQCTTRDLERMSSMATPPPVIAVYGMKEDTFEDTFNDLTMGHALILALDSIQDPGNLGTIMRVCDWMGVDTVLASHGTADVYSPKVVQATMGAIARVRVLYGDLPSILKSADMPIFGTFLNGENMYTAELPTNGIIVIGNEGNGISPGVAECVNRRITIPSYPPQRRTSESLNAATATAITLAMFRRKAMVENLQK